MSKVLLIGSGNRDKAAELADLLAPLGWEVKSLRDFPEVDEPEETGASFEENALLKARYYGERFEVDCVADDSGLEVDALDGAPGVYSARYAGEGCSYSDNNEKLLRELSTIPEEKRTARFLCCAAFVPREGESHTALGVVEGVIAKAARGASGFGYDPVFIPEGDTRSFAEMTPAEKHEISHRGRAFEQLRAYLETLA
jgi:non-canonical purine NTP pyrophosphatase (RdgB/HAM1 family)